MNYRITVIAITIFVLAAILDWFWAEYISWVAKKNALRASLFSGLIYVTGGSITIVYTHDWKALIVAALGSMTGTYVAVKRQKDKDNGNQDK